jgi:branched-chain amino acid transport system substrate-binding protein
MRAWARIAAIGVVVLVAGACTGSNSENRQDASGEVRIGVLAPLSGPNRAAGTDELRGAQLAAALVNGEEGPVPLLDVTTSGLSRLGGPKVTIVPADTKSDPARGVSEAIRLASQERVVALAGAYDTEVTAAASARTERIGIPFMNGDTSTVYLTERGLDWFFRTAPTDRMFGQAFFSTLFQKRVKPRRITILYDTGTRGEDLHAAIHNLAPEAGYEEHGMVTFEPGTPNLVPAVREVRDEKRPEALFIGTSNAGDAVRVLKTLDAMNYRPPALIVTGTGFSDPRIFGAAGPSAEGLLYSSAWSRGIAARNPSAKPIMDRYEERYNSPMSEVAAGSFTAVLTLAAGINAAGSVDPQRVRGGLIGLDLPGSSMIMPWGGVQFDAASHQNVRASGTVEQLAQGGPRVVYPPELAQAEGA